MDRLSAIRIVRETFNGPFDKGRFVHFVRELFNAIDESPFIYRGNFIPDAYDSYIRTFERIGKYQDVEGNKIDILIVQLKKGSSLEHARTMQRNFVAWYLNGSRGGELKDAAVAAFVALNSEDWRFSLVKMEYHLAESKDGKIKPKQELTPARRWSFLVGKNENSHTAQKQLLPVLQDDQNNSLLSQLEDAFNIEVVTKEFFEKYRGLFLKAKDSLDEIVRKDAEIAKDFNEKGIDTVNFAKKLLGQIVFLYFLQRKGWFGVKRHEVWGTGSKNFLRELFEKKHGDYKNFFNDILEPLFYNTLAIERPKDYSDRFDCKIPFLNGGLFDPINDYDWVDTDILMPNELFSNTQKTKEGDVGTGILDVFDRYNFTVKEDEPLEKEVAVDPEMLGKVFENLLEVKDRKSKGTYYTPREIVHYMCQESLVNYLATELKGKVSKEDIEILVRYGETAVEHDAIYLEKLLANSDYKGKYEKSKLPKSVEKNAELIDEKLASVRICDPAVGSGAFLVGIMTEIVRTRNALTNFITNKTNRSMYDFKRHAIQNCLYAVDIDSGAVEIAKLRLWLSLVVDEEDIKQIKPLPNLDYKIVSGNSLLGVEKNLFNQELFARLEELKPLFFNEINNRKKREHKEQIDDLISQITNGHKDFDFEVYFSEVFRENGGFHVVIANPPYISFGLRDLSKAKEDWANYMRTHYPRSAEYKLSIYAIFMDKGIQLLKDKGVLTYITPDSFLLGRYFSKLRGFMLQSCKIQEIVMFEKDFWQSGVVGRPVISILQKQSDANERSSNYLTATSCRLPDELNTEVPQSYSYEQRYFESIKHNRFRLFFDKMAMSYVRAIEEQSVPLGTIARIATGVRSRIGQKKIISETPKNKYWKKGIISGSQVEPFKVHWKGHYLNINKDILWAGGWDANIVENPKLMIRQTCDSLIVGIDYEGLYHLNNVHSLSLKHTGVVISLECLCAILNSRLMNRYYHLISLEKNRTMAQTDIETLETLPIRVPSKDIQDRVQEIVRNDATSAHLRKAIEDYIMNAYELPEALRYYLQKGPLY